MNIANMMGTSTSSALEAIYGERKKQDEEEGLSVASWKKDTVSISAEAASLAKQMENRLGVSGASEQPNFAADDQQAERENGAVGGSGGGMGSGNDTRQLEAKIKELQSKLSSIQSSNIPEESKEAMTAAIQAELNAAMQELNAAQAAA